MWAATRSDPRKISTVRAVARDSTRPFVSLILKDAGGLVGTASVIVANVAPLHYRVDMRP
jgi:hypothetical protein